MSAERETSTIRDYMLAIVIGLAIAVVAGCNSFYDDDASPLERAQRRQAAIEQCREQFGFNARLEKARDGHLKCRRAGPAT